AHPFPAALEDAAAAYAWLTHEGKAFGADLSRLVLAGESAGGNLVTALALCACARRQEPFARTVWSTGVVPRAVLPIYALLQVSDPQRFRRRFPQLSAFLMDVLLEVERAYLARTRADSRDLADPLLLLERGGPFERPLPAFFAACGTRDPLVDDTRRLEQALGWLGAACEARYYPGELHAFHALLGRPAAQRCWREMFAFLDRVLSATEDAEQVGRG